ncbi:hypothetical protein A2U01_0093790, partial [Trifolium medium]|nr:hypothetical protein [Trifolium medium]
MFRRGHLETNLLGSK